MFCSQDRIVSPFYPSHNPNMSSCNTLTADVFMLHTEDPRSSSIDKTLTCVQCTLPHKQRRTF